MARARLPIVPHLTHDEIARRYRACRHAIEKTHWQILWLLTRPEEPPTPAEVAEAVGLTAGWVRSILKRWNAQGPDGLTDRRAGNGAEGKLTPERRSTLFEEIQRRPPDGGLWTGPKVAARAHELWGVKVSKQTGWEWLRALNFTPQVPRPLNPGAATPEQQREWKRRHGGAGGRAAPPPPGGAGGAVGPG